MKKSTVKTWLNAGFKYIHMPGIKSSTPLLFHTLGLLHEQLHYSTRHQLSRSPVQLWQELVCFAYTQNTENNRLTHTPTAGQLSLFYTAHSAHMHTEISPQNTLEETLTPHHGPCHKRYLSSGGVWLPWVGCRATVATLICAMGKEQGIPLACGAKAATTASVWGDWFPLSTPYPLPLSLSYSRPTFTLCSVSWGNTHSRRSRRKGILGYTSCRGNRGFHHFSGGAF